MGNHFRNLKAGKTSPATKLLRPCQGCWRDEITESQARAVDEQFFGTSLRLVATSNIGFYRCWCNFHQEHCQIVPPPQISDKPSCSYSGPTWFWIRSYPCGLGLSRWITYDRFVQWRRASFVFMILGYPNASLVGKSLLLPLLDSVEALEAAREGDQWRPRDGINGWGEGTSHWGFSSHRGWSFCPMDW